MLLKTVEISTRIVYASRLTIFGLTWHTTERAESSSLLSKQSDREGDRLAGHGLARSRQGDVVTSGCSHGPLPRHHDTSAGATPTTIASPNLTIIPDNNVHICLPIRHYTEY
ncbi:unnamed protein product [Colias eurytheme]|nr:unnamed protein product [Colias eurytheme]